MKNPKTNYETLRVNNGRGGIRERKRLRTDLKQHEKIFPFRVPLVESEMEGGGLHPTPLELFLNKKASIGSIDFVFILVSHLEGKAFLKFWAEKWGYK